MSGGGHGDPARDAASRRYDERAGGQSDDVIEIDRERTATTDEDAAAESGDEAGTSAETAQIISDIERTRADMTDTIEAIQERLNPQRLTDQVKEQVQDHVQEVATRVREDVREATIGRAEHMVDDVMDTARETGSGIMDTIRENPLPAALAAIGLGWLWMRRPSPHQGWERYRGRDGGRRRYGGYRGYAENDEGGYDFADYGYRGGDPWREGRYRESGRAGYGGYRRSDAPGEAGGPGEAIGQAGRQVRDTASRAVDQVQDTAGRAADTVQDKAGQAVDAAQDTAGRVAATVGSAAGQAGQTVQQAAGQAVDRVGYATQSVQDAAAQASWEARYRASQARYSLEGALQDNPLGIGALALAVGVAVGLAAPSTEFEQGLLGDTRDTVVRQAQETAQDTLHKVRRVAERVADEATDTAREEAQRQGLAGRTG